MRLMKIVYILIFTSSLLAHESGFENIKIRIENVNKNIWCVFGAGGNIGISVGEDGILMIDDQFAPLAEKIQSALENKFHKKIKYIINTHWHGDHTGGNEAFSKIAPIIAQQNVKTRLQNIQKRGSRVFPKRPKEAWPTISYQKHLELEFNNEEVVLTHLPNGHTDGDSIVYFSKSKVLHMGDHFFTKRFPFIDIHTGGSVSGYLKNLSFVLKNFSKETKLIPGHGILSSMSDLEKYYQMILNTNKMVQDKKRAKKSLELIIKEGLGDKFKSYAWGFISEKKWIEVLFVDKKD
ncbi:MAG: MBL fold metallo-hydrolase [Candidatus Cloacimonadota bacterium]|nr:MAG: MBL fold metallo-hydrolase [Candidatus Cloacimonadota bacterium]